MDDTLRQFETLGISLALGLLVGLQRERANSRLAGMRTFPLITLLGTVAALVGLTFGGWVIAAGMIAVTGMAVIGNYLKAQTDDADPGLTTEIAMLVMYGLGAYLVVGPWEITVAMGVAIAALLHFKPELHGVADRLGENDLRGIMQFALITFVVLPVLPNRTIGPYDVFNPFQAWLMVVFIVGIGLAGFLLQRFVGEKIGVILAGLLGGAISSTATTLSYARRTAKEPSLLATSVVVIGLATCVLYVRVLAEIAVVSPSFVAHAAGPIVIIFLLTLGSLAVMAWRGTMIQTAKIENSNPTELWSAMVFGAIYVGILFAMAAAKEWLGREGVFTVAFLSGMTDTDAVTLSTAQLVSKEKMPVVQGWQTILVALLSNMIFKTGLGWLVGGRTLGWRLALLFAAPSLGGLLLILAGPAIWENIRSINL